MAPPEKRERLADYFCLCGLDESGPAALQAFSALGEEFGLADGGSDAETAHAAADLWLHHIVGVAVVDSSGLALDGRDDDTPYEPVLQTPTGKSAALRAARHVLYGPAKPAAYLGIRRRLHRIVARSVGTARAVPGVAHTEASGATYVTGAVVSAKPPAAPGFAHVGADLYAAYSLAAPGQAHAPTPLDDMVVLRPADRTPPGYTAPAAPPEGSTWSKAASALWHSSLRIAVRRCPSNGYCDAALRASVLDRYVEERTLLLLLRPPPTPDHLRPPPPLPVLLLAQPTPLSQVPAHRP